MLQRPSGCLSREGSKISPCGPSSTLFVRFSRKALMELPAAAQGHIPRQPSEASAMHALGAPFVRAKVRGEARGRRSFQREPPTAGEEPTRRRTDKRSLRSSVSPFFYEHSELASASRGGTAERETLHSTREGDKGGGERAPFAHFLVAASALPSSCFPSSFGGCSTNCGARASMPVPVPSHGWA